MKSRYDEHYRQCYQCGKLFFVPDYETYVFRRDTKYFCSWGCMRKYDGNCKSREERNAEKLSHYEKVKRCYDCQANIEVDGQRICYIGVCKRVFPNKAACKRFVKRRGSNGDC